MENKTKANFDTFISDHGVSYVMSGNTIVLSTNKAIASKIAESFKSSNGSVSTGNLLEGGCDFMAANVCSVMRNSMVFTRVQADNTFGFSVSETIVVSDSVQGIKDVLAVVMEDYSLNNGNSFCHLERVPNSYMRVKTSINNKALPNCTICGGADAANKETVLLNLIEEANDQEEM